MMSSDELNIILERIASGTQTATDVEALRVALSTRNQDLRQLGKYNVNLGQGEDIHIGDRTYVTWNDEAIQALIEVVQKLQSTTQTPTPLLASVDELVQQVRSRLHDDIQRLHGTMPLWGVDRWVPLGELFVDVNILEELSSSRRSELEDLWHDFQSGIQASSSHQSLDRIGLGKRKQRISGLAILERDTNLLVVGKPGSGKTTYLQRLVTECNSGNLQSHKIPVLIKLREFIEDSQDISYSLEHYLERYWQLSKSETNVLLKQGRALILLDGLDEISGKLRRSIANKIKHFSRTYSQLQMIVTCRTQSLPQETEMEWKAHRFDFVEVADFDNNQVHFFAHHWFNTTESLIGKLQKAESSKFFLSELFKEANKQIRELAISPILLSLTCAVFQQTGKFYSKRSKLYEEGLALLLERWDSSRGVKRDEVYRNLSVNKKIELLKYLAANKLFKSQYILFEKLEIQEYIADFLKIGRSDSRAVLKSIESQHGLLIERANNLWSFSHLTFQEHFAAKWLNQLKDCKDLNDDILGNQWHEPIKLAIDEKQPADLLLRILKRNIDSSIENEEKLQFFLATVYKKAESIKASYKPAAIRAFYFDINRERQNIGRLAAAYTRDYNLACTLDNSFSRHLTFMDELFRDLKLDYLLDVDLGNASVVEVLRYGAIGQAQSLSRQRAYVCARSCDRKLAHELKKLKAQLPNPSVENWGAYIEWWDIYGKEWIDRFRDLISKKRKICHDWQFTDQQEQSLGKYYSAIGFLLHLLQMPNAVSTEVYQEIEDSILLPIIELRKRQSNFHQYEHSYINQKHRLPEVGKWLKPLALLMTVVTKILKKLQSFWNCL